MASHDSDMRLPPKQIVELHQYLSQIDKLRNKLSRNRATVTQVTEPGYIVKSTKLSHDLQLDVSIPPTEAADLTKRWQDNIKTYQNSQRLIMVDVINSSIARNETLVVSLSYTMVETIVKWHLNCWNRTSEMVTAPTKMLKMTYASFANMLLQCEPSSVNVDKQCNMFSMLREKILQAPPTFTLNEDADGDTTEDIIQRGKLHTFLQGILTQAINDIVEWSSNLQQSVTKLLLQSIKSKVKHDQLQANTGVISVADTHATTTDITDSDLTASSVKEYIQSFVKKCLEETPNIQVPQVTTRHQNQSQVSASPASTRKNTPKKTPKKTPTPQVNTPTSAPTTSRVLKSALRTPQGPKSLAKSPTTTRKGVEFKRDTGTLAENVAAKHSGKTSGKGKQRKGKTKQSRKQKSQ